MAERSTETNSFEDLQRQVRETAEALAKPWQDMAEAFTSSFQEWTSAATSMDFERMGQASMDAFNAWLEQQQKLAETMADAVRPFAEQAEKATNAFMENLRSLGGTATSEGDGDKAK